MDEWTKTRKMADTLTAYQPTLRDHIANLLLGLGGDHPPQWLHDEVGGLVGSTGLGVRPGGGLADFTPVGTVLSGDEAIQSAREGDYKGAAFSTASALAGMAGPAAKALKLLKGAKGELAVLPEVEYDPPWHPQRSFNQDYPDDAGISDVSGKLVKSIDGDPLTAEIIAGRRQKGLGDTGLSAGELEELAKRTTGYPSQRADRDFLQGARGATEANLDTGELGRVFVADGLHPNDEPRVLAHELGHVIDIKAGNIPTDGLQDELPALYHSNLTGEYFSKSPAGPLDVGYTPDQAREEYMAEAIRSYLLDPNSIKTTAPKTAERIRQAVNAHPLLKDIIQFNSVAAPLAGGGYLATQTNRSAQPQNQNAKDAFMRAILGDGL